MKVKIAYICDGLDKCSDKIGCFRCGKPGMSDCHHTFDPKHAKFGACEDPKACPERFHKIDGTIDDCEVYWEGEFNFPSE